MSILAAVDGDDSPDRVVEVAADLAAAYGDDLVALHVMSQQHFDSIRENLGEGRGHIVQGPGGLIYQSASSDRTETYDLDVAMRDAAEVAESVVRETLGDASGAEAKGLVGNTVEEILDEAGRIDARYIVVGGRKRTAVGKAIFGSVTQSVLLEADTPVVAVMED